MRSHFISTTASNVSVSEKLLLLGDSDFVTGITMFYSDVFSKFLTRFLNASSNRERQLTALHYYNVRYSFNFF